MEFRPAIKMIIELLTSVPMSFHKEAFVPKVNYLNKITHYHMQSDCSWVTEYSQILADSAWAMHQLCLIISCVVLRNLNEFIKLSTEIGVRTFCIVHPRPIHL